MTASVKDFASCAKNFASQFEEKVRDGGGSYFVLRDDSPEWMEAAVYAAHSLGADHILPDDWRYRFCAEVASAVAARAEELKDDDREFATETEDERFEIVDSLTSIYTHELTAWLASTNWRCEYVDEACEELGYGADVTLTARLSAGQFAEISEVYSAITDAIAKQVAS